MELATQPFTTHFNSSINSCFLSRISCNRVAYSVGVCEVIRPLFRDNKCLADALYHSADAPATSHPAATSCSSSPSISTSIACSCAPHRHSRALLSIEISVREKLRWVTAWIFGRMRHLNMSAVHRRHTLPLLQRNAIA